MPGRMDLSVLLSNSDDNPNRLELSSDSSFITERQFSLYGLPYFFFFFSKIIGSPTLASLFSSGSTSSALTGLTFQIFYDNDLQYK